MVLRSTTSLSIYITLEIAQAVLLLRRKFLYGMVYKCFVTHNFRVYPRDSSSCCPPLYITEPPRTQRDRTIYIRINKTTWHPCTSICIYFCSVHACVYTLYFMSVCTHIHIMHTRTALSRIFVNYRPITRANNPITQVPIREKRRKPIYTVWPYRKFPIRGMEKVNEGLKSAFSGEWLQFGYLIKHIV